MTARVRRPTIKDVANAAGVSTTTVSFVLNRTGSISDDVRKRVFEAAEQVRYSPNRQAAAVRTGKSQTLGLVIPDLRNPFFPELAQAVSEAAKAADHVVLLAVGDTYEAERESLVQLVAHGVDGICWCPAGASNTIAELGPVPPVVIVDRPLAGFDTVTSNFVRAGALIAEELQRIAASTVGLITGPADLPGADERSAALANALHGLTNVIWAVSHPYDMNISASLKAQIATNAVRAIVCDNDIIAIGVCRHLQSIGIRVPEDVYVLGIDDIPWSGLVNPPLTSVRQRLDEIGKMAIEVLLARIAGPTTPLQEVRVDVEIIRRTSTLHTLR